MAPSYPTSSFRRTPDSCSAGTVPHPVPGCCRQLGLGTAEPFSSLGVPVATGMSDCYENGAQPPHIVIPAKSLPRTPIRGRYQSQRRGSQFRLKQWAGPIFIPLCGLRKAMVIPAKSLPRTRYGAGIQRAVSQLGLRRSGPPMLICLRSYSVVSGCRAGQGIGRARTVRD